MLPGWALDFSDASVPRYKVFSPKVHGLPTPVLSLIDAKASFLGRGFRF